MKKVLFLVLFFAASLGLNAHAAVVLNEAAPDFALTDSNGQEHHLFDFKGKHVVLEWVNFECPFVRKHYDGGNMQGLQKEFTARDVVWLSINSSAEGNQRNFKAEEINARIVTEGAAPTAYLIDASGDVGRMYGAKTTPHMFVINPDGVLVYEGAIDDTPSYDSADIPNSVNYVREALTQSMDGAVVATPQSKSYGCSVKY